MSFMEALWESGKLMLLCVGSTAVLILWIKFCAENIDDEWLSFILCILPVILLLWLLISATMVG